MRILVIEDNPADVALVEAHLGVSIDGASIEGVGRLGRGLARLDEACFDLVLLDLGLPDSDGLVGLEHVLAADDPLPVIVLTGLADDRLGRQAVKAGAQDYVHKGSIGSGVLVKAVHHAVERHALQREVRRQGEMLRRSVASFRGIASNADGLVILGPDHAVRWCNDAAAALLDAGAPADLVGRPFEHPAVVGQEATFAVDGKTLQMRVVDTEWEGEEARLGSIRDVTRQVRAEADLLQAQKMSLLGRLAGGIAHDFSNVLTGLLGQADLLRERLEADGVAVKGVDGMIRDLSLLGRLTSHLRSFGRQQVVALQPVDLNLLVEESAPLLAKIVGEAASLEIDLEPGLPEVQADPVQLEQVLLNLVSNAADAVEAGGRVRVTTRRRGSAALELSVRDDGCGMDEETLRRAPEAFFTTRTETQSGSMASMGLGLATVQDIVERSLGDLTLRSEPGRGTMARVVLPATEPASIQSFRSGEFTKPVTPTETVLVVDDEGVIRDVVGRVLERQGYTVMTAPSGPAALQRVLGYAGPLDLLITDVMMPEMDGRELAKQVRTLRPSVRVLFIPGYDEHILAPTGVLDEGVAFLAKPFRMDQALRTVRGVLDGPESGDVLVSLPEDALAVTTPGG